MVRMALHREGYPQNDEIHFGPGREPSDPADPKTRDRGESGKADALDCFIFKYNIIIEIWDYGF